MRTPPIIKRAYDRLGFPGAAFAVCLPLGLIPWVANGLFQFLATVFGFWLGLRLIRKFTHKAIWRLRNRLIVTYMFIALVPLLLIVALSLGCAYALMSQFTVHLLTTEMNRRIEVLTAAADSLKVMDPARRLSSMDRMVDLFFKDRFQGIQVVLRDRGSITRYPNDLGVHAPPDGWKDASGLMLRDNHFYGWAYRKLADGGDVTVSAPFSPEYLASLLPELGAVRIVSLGDNDDASTAGGGVARNNLIVEKELPASRLPQAVNSFDIPLTWWAAAPLHRWEDPKRQTSVLLQVQSRPSRVFSLLYGQGANDLRSTLPIALLTVAILFLLVVAVALVIGVSMTRTMTGAVHRLYEGTQRVMQGDFTHRIQVKGADQLAGLGHSFNLMTENVERLLAVAKEKERLHSEIEIAREVQSQLYPKLAQHVTLLQVKAVCKPARMVSGDYFDYGPVKKSKVALALGDVAGKGISAALLMATLQSAFRTHMTSFESTGDAAKLSPAELVTQLNLHLCKNTSSEKFATFFMGLYDSETSALTYTNAGHLPPILFRNGASSLLEIDGTVVGAFPFAQYGESTIKLEPGDLLFCYTDGISEPENAYGEMYGDDRLIDTISRNLHRSDDQIIEAVIDSVCNWTGSPELQDDMTILMARRN